MNAQAIELRPNAAMPALEVAPVASSALTPAQMVYQLMAAGTPIESVREMMALSKELAADEALRAFDGAVADAKAEIKPIVKNRNGHSGKYADMAAYAAGIDEILGRHGLSYRHTVPAQTDKTITVACKLSHRGGHSEITPLTAGFDTSGSKNAIQSMGSTLTYLQRYSLVMALGLAAAIDDDGKGASGAADDGAKLITKQQADELRDLIRQAKSTPEKFCEVGNIDAIENVKATDFANAKAMLLGRIKKMAEAAAAISSKVDPKTQFDQMERGQ